MIKVITRSKFLLHLGLPMLTTGGTQILHGVRARIPAAEWGLPILSKEARIFTLMRLLRGHFSAGREIRIVPPLGSLLVKVSRTRQNMLQRLDG